MSIVFNSIGTILKKAAEAAERSKTYQNKPAKFNPLGGESAEEFFSRMEEEQSKPAKKLRLNAKHQESPPIVSPAPKKESKYEFKAPQHDEVETLPETTKKSRKVKHRINPKDKKTLRKAIIVNEVLGRPKAYEF